MPTLDLTYSYDGNDLLGEEGVRLRDQAIDALEALQEYLNRRSIEHTVIQCVVSVKVKSAEEPGK